MSTAATRIAERRRLDMERRKAKGKAKREVAARKDTWMAGGEKAGRKKVGGRQQKPRHNRRNSYVPAQSTSTTITPLRLDAVSIDTSSRCKSSRSTSSSSSFMEPIELHRPFEGNSIGLFLAHLLALPEEQLTFEFLSQLEDVQVGVPDSVIAQLRTHEYVPCEAADDCAICLEQFAKSEEVMTLPCRHNFHSECITPWLRMNKKCPYCKQEVE